MEEDNYVCSYIHEAAKRGYTEQIKEALVTDKDGINKKDSLGNTPLSWAASGGHLEAVKLLIELGSDVNSVNNNGDTPLHRAAWKNSPDVCSYLLSHGAEKSRDMKNKDGKTPMEISRLLEVRVTLQPPSNNPDEKFDQEEEDSD